jgi:metal-responsive CopG/Arc/MetJ family transcriptional regulator
MKTIKVSVTLSPNILEALDAAVKVLGEKSRSALVERALRDYPEIYEIWQGIVEANKQ